MIDAEQVKRNNDIVQTIGRFVDLKKQGSDYKGCCPFHTENTPSFNVNDRTQSYKCFGCDAGGDVIEFIMKLQNLDFKAACEFLGAEQTDSGSYEPPKKTPAKKTPAKKTPPKVKAKIVPLSYEAAKDHYTHDALEATSQFLTEGKKLVKAWKFLNEDSEVEVVTARWEDSDGKKTVLTYYWDGTGLKMKNYPVLLYNRDRLKNEQEKDVLIVFGEKCAEIVDEHLSDQFIPVTWNGGEKKVKDVDFSPIENRTVFCWPDDDVKHDKEGQLLPQDQQPGTITAEAIKKLIPQVQTVDFIPELREIEPDGADIYEAFQHFAGDYMAIVDHIYKNSHRIETKTDNLPTVVDQPKEKPVSNTFPFEILGIADDGKAYFISDTNRMLAFNPTSISKTQLINLTNVDWWRDSYGKGREDWEDAVSDMIAISSVRDFDPDRMRGRGAWKELDGRICYHDGKNTVGEYDQTRLFIRRPQKDIGLNIEPATAKQRSKIYLVAGDLTFQTTADCIRTLGWSVLAPFAGALTWRPAGLLTGASGSGKTTIVDFIIKQISMAIYCSGGESTAAGIRQDVGIDSYPVIVEESDDDTKKKKQNREDTFSLMRQSTSDDSPKVLKGTTDGRGMSFVLRSMFMFVSITPVIESEADENRLFRINLTKGKHTSKEWAAKENQLKQSVTPEICQGIAAYTWQNLSTILALAKKITPEIQKISGFDNRTSFAEATLISAHLAVFEDNLNPDQEYLTKFLNDFYENADTDRIRNENEEMFDSIMSHILRVGQDNFTVRELTHHIIKALPDYEPPELSDAEDETDRFMKPSDARRILGMYGIGVDPAGDIAIQKNSKELMKILDRGKGWHHQLKRHPRLKSGGVNVGLGSATGTQNCIIIGRGDDA